MLEWLETELASIEQHIRDFEQGATVHLHGRDVTDIWLEEYHQRKARIEEQITRMKVMRT